MRTVQPVGQPRDILDSMLLTTSNDPEARKGNNKRREEGRVAWPASHMGEGDSDIGADVSRRLEGQSLQDLDHRLTGISQP